MGGGGNIESAYGFCWWRLDAPETRLGRYQLSGHVGRGGAYDGPSAIVIAHDFRPDIVFLYIAMPDIDGYEVARHLRSQLPTSRMHFVAVSCYGQTRD